MNKNASRAKQKARSSKSVKNCGITLFCYRNTSLVSRLGTLQDFFNDNVGGYLKS